MLRFITLIISLTLNSAAIAEQFSIRCAREVWHYVTFDTESNRVVYESASGSALKGQIISSIGDEIKFDLIQLGSPKFDLIWRQDDGTLTWIGLSGDPTRPTMTFNCAKNPLRPILSIYDQIAPMK
jgi:hypothetical protein